MTAHRIIPVLVIVLGAACAEDVTAPELFPHSLQPVSAVYQQTVVASRVGEPPSVIVRDQNGDPMSQVAVRFTIVTPATSVEVTEVRTDARGIATMEKWTLSTRAGVNEVIATVRSLSASFSAVGIGGPPAALMKRAGDDQFALPGSTLLTPQEVSVRDVYDNPVSGATVHFSVTGGGGSIGTPSAVSDGDGVARGYGWVLGMNGPQMLTATVDGIPAVTFTASVSGDPCRPLTRPLSAVIDLLEYGCTMPDGRIANFLTIDAPIGDVYRIAQVAGTFDATLALTTEDGTPIAIATPSPQSKANFRVFLEKGRYVLRVISSSPGVADTYRLSFDVVTNNQSCEDTYLSVGSKIYDALDKGDCTRDQFFYFDRYRVFLAAGTRVTVMMASEEVDNVIDVTDPEGVYVTGTHQTGLYGGQYGARVGFTAAKTGYYLVVATTDYFPGSYNLVVER